MTEQHWRTMGRQPCLMNRDGVFVLHVDYAKQKGGKRQNWKRVYSSDQFKPGGWTTEAAALAARSEFKHWVDYEMNQVQRAGQVASSGRRSPATLATALSPLPPTRVSGRKRSRAGVVTVSV